MVTRDPAVEAAQRAERASKWWDSGNQTAWDSDYAEAAAREALAPIRALHRPDGDYGYQTQCVACGLMWPCDTARLIYSTEELPNV